MCGGKEIFFTQNFVQIKTCLEYKNTTLLKRNNCFQCTQCHQNSNKLNCNWCTYQERKQANWNKTQGSEQMKLQMTCELVTVKSSSLTNSTESITNRFKLNEERSHRPTRTTRQKETYKTYTLTLNSQISNSTKLCNTHSQSKSSSSSNCRKKGNQPKRVTYLLKKELGTQPNNSCFPSFFGKISPRSRQTICIHSIKRKIFFNIFRINRTILFSSPLQMNTFQCLSIPKSTNRFTQSRQCTISCLCMRMIHRMISSQYQYNHSNCH